MNNVHTQFTKVATTS